MKFRIKTLRANDIGREVVGVDETTVSYVSNINYADRNCLTFYNLPEIEILKEVKAGIILVDNKLKEKITKFKAKSLVLCENPLYEFVKILSDNFEDTYVSDVKESLLDSRLKIAENSYIEQNVSIGFKSEIYPGVYIYSNTKIGEDCRIQSSTSIGSIGLGYAINNGTYERFPHLGGILIGNKVDIGSNVTVVKGVLQNTVIGDGTKIGNNVNIGHNVEIGKNCFISSGVTIAGSARIEDGCWIGPGVTILNKVLIRRNTEIGIGSVVNKDTDEDSFYIGYPSRKLSNKVN